MKLLASTKSKIAKSENGENVPHLQSTEVRSVHCNIVDNDDQQYSRILYIFGPNKSFDQLLDISPKTFYIFKNKPLGIEDKINITLVIK